MADKKQQTPAEPIGEVAQAAMEFNKAVYKLGLLLIENYRTGCCRDANATLTAIIEIFKVQPKTP